MSSFPIRMMIDPQNDTQAQAEALLVLGIHSVYPRAHITDWHFCSWEIGGSWKGHYKLCQGLET